MSRRRAGRRRAAVALIALLLATLAPLTPAARGADETRPGEPVELPVQPGVENTFDPVRAQPPADITVGEAGGGASPDLGQPRVEPPADIAPEARTDVADLRGEYHAAYSGLIHSRPLIDFDDRGNSSRRVRSD